MGRLNGEEKKKVRKIVCLDGEWECTLIKRRQERKRKKK